MKIIKHPKWDKQDTNEPLTMFDPSGPNDKITSNIPLKIDQEVMATINGNEITMKIKNILNNADLESEVIKIINNKFDTDKLDDILLYDIVSIKTDEIKTIDVG